MLFTNAEDLLKFATDYTLNILYPVFDRLLTKRIAVNHRALDFRENLPHPVIVGSKVEVPIALAQQDAFNAYTG